MDAPIDAPKFTAWAAPITDEQEFKREQARLGRVWTFVGRAQDVGKDGDWFTATLGGRSIFVQRFGDTLKGFENRCAHRFFPLRTADKGNGPIKCGFHHWLYNEEGRAVGIPNSQDLFEATPREIDAHLAAVEIATCGWLVFGRFPDGSTTESLAEFLGEGFSILESMCPATAAPRPVSLFVEANWKLCYHISLDDYHSPAVHPATFGKGGYLKRDALRYFRFGPHSAFFPGADESGLAAMVAACRDGSYRPVRYRIFQIFPNLAVALFRATQYWYVIVQQYVPVAPNRSFMRAWYYRAPFSTGRGWFGQMLDQISEPGRARIVGYYIRQVHKEDNGVVERLQTVAGQLEGWPRLGYAEERIKWFEEAYAQALSAEPLTLSDKNRDAANDRVLDK